MIGNLALKFFGSVLLLVAVIVGGYYAIRTTGVRTLTAALEENLTSGDYLAALGAAGTLREKGEMTPELEKKVTHAAALLVAADAYKKAQTAFAEDRYGDAAALLKESTAITDGAFPYLLEAQELYSQAEALAAGVAHRTNVTISTLQEQTALAAEQARAKALMEEVAKETKKKFVNELAAYRDIALRGKIELDNAVTEINARRDVTALVYLSQAKVLFEEAQKKVGDLRSGSGSGYSGIMDSLANALALFLDSGKDLRNAVIYIEDKGNNSFTSNFESGKTKLANGVAYLSTVTDFISANR